MPDKAPYSKGEHPNGRAAKDRVKQRMINDGVPEREAERRTVESLNRWEHRETGNGR